MATVRGMTPEAIRALLRKELGDYQALNIAVNSAKGASESAIAEVENIRNDIKNMDFDFDDSKLDEAMEKFDKDMAELNEALDEVKTEALTRENKLTALEKSLNQDRTKFNKEMQDMAQELAESKTELDQKLAEAAETLATNVTDVGERLSEELKNANKTISEDLAKDLAKLNTDLTEAFGKDLKSLETRQNSKTDRLDKELKNYKSNTDSKMGTLLSEIDKAKAFADGFLQPGNLVWNPMALDNARYITTNNDSVKIESAFSSDRKVGAVKTTKTGTSATYIDYGASQNSTFELKKGDVIVVSAWIRSSVELPPNAIGLKVGYVVPPYYNPNKIPANRWVQISGEVECNRDPDRASYFSVLIDGPTPRNAIVWITEPHAKKKVTSDLIVDGAVTSKSLATGAVTAGKIAADAVTANNILAGSIGAKHIFAKAIGTDQLAANAVTADKIKANAVDADKIKAKSIGTGHLVANAVTTEKLAAKAVKADNIDANAVTAQKIASKAINGDHIQANSIDTTKLTIMPGNLFPDPHFQDSCWGTSGSSYAHSNNGGEFRLYPNGVEVGKYYKPSGVGDKALMLEPNSSYRITMNLWSNVNVPKGCELCVYVRYKRVGGNYGPSLRVKIPVTTGTSIESAIFTTPNMDSSLCTIGFFVIKPWNGGQISIWDVHLTRAADASLIVKGGVHADHIAANQITSKHISVDSIDGDRIKSNTLDADKIKANSLTSDHVKFKKGFINEAMIGDAQITDAKIENLNAKKITAGEMDGSRIRAGTLDANRIKAGTLDAKQIATGTLDAKRIGAGTITGDHIKANSISVGELRADAIIQSGMSLIPTEATGPKGALEPIWWKGLTKYSDRVYEGEPWYGTNKYITPIPKTIMTKILPGATYRVEFNIQASKAGSRIFIEMRDQNGAHAVASGAPNLRSKGKPRIDGDTSQFIKTRLDYRESTTAGENYLVDDFDVPTAPTNVVSYIKFKPGVTHVYLSRLYFNHSRGSVQDAAIRINNLRVEADIPDQKEIDLGQDNFAQFTRRMTDNIARYLTRASKTNVEMFDIKGGTRGYDNNIGILVRTPNGDRNLRIYMFPEWSGTMYVDIVYSNGSTTTINLRSYGEFKTTTANATSKRDHLAGYYTPDRFKMCEYTVPLGNIENFRFFIKSEVNYDNMYNLLAYNNVLLNRPLAHGIYKPPPPNHSSTIDPKDVPPWDYMGTVRR